MKIKERISRAGNWLRGRRIVAALGRQRWVGTVRAGAALCRKNPFPAQAVLFVVYRLALDAMYLLGLSPLYGYTGFTVDLSPLRYGVSLLAVVVFAPFLARVQEGNSASSILVTLLHYFYFIPLTSYCGCKGSAPGFLLVGLLYWALLLFWQLKLPIPHLAPLCLRHTHRLAVAGTVLSSLFVLLVSGKYAHFRLTLNFIDVYGIRAEAANYAMPRVVSYGIGMMPVVLALLLAYWLRQKRYGISGALVVVYLFLFSIAAHKTQFFFLFLILGCSFFYRTWMLRWASGALALLALGGVLENRLLGTFYLIWSLFRRMMYIPVWLAEQYAVFFAENPLNLFRNGIMGRFSFENTYSTTIPYVVGEFLGSPDMSANTGLLGDLFANLPCLLGLALLPLVLILCFRLLDLASYRLHPGLLMAVCIYFANKFMNGSWSTVLLSGGFLLACLLVYIFPKEEGVPQ